VLSPFTRQVAGMYFASPNSKDLAVLKELIETGKLRPVIDRTYPLHQTPDAFRYLEESHARGKVVITIIEQRSVA
jgi:NADPH:quinone reductase-like Zn-dependent oxidoreductase